MKWQQFVEQLSSLLREGTHRVQQGQLSAGQEQYEQALTLIQQAQQALAKHPDTPDERIEFVAQKEAICLNNMGVVYRSQGDLSRALDYYQRALKIDQAIAPHSTQTATRLNNIGAVYNSQGDLSRALEYYQQAVEVIEALRFRAGDHTAREGVLAQHLVSPKTLLLSFCLVGSLAVGWAVRDAAHPDGVQMWEVGDASEISGAAQIAAAEFNLLPRIAAYERLLRQAEAPDGCEQIIDILTLLQVEWSEVQPEVAEAWEFLSHQLWGVIRSDLKQGITHLILLPDGDLSALPFDLLPDTETGKMLGEVYSLTYAPSATALDRLRDLWSSGSVL
jgi:tetratricopeptide (TPR) repeat protein